MGDIHFGSVKKARAALLAKAELLLEGYIALIEKAARAGEYDAAFKAYQHLLDHIPGEDGERLFEQTVDKPKVTEGYKGPTIQIGFKLGGLNHDLPALAEPPVIDVEPSPEDEK